MQIKQNNKVLFQADNQFINVGYGEIKGSEIMLNGNLNKIPETKLYRNKKMTCSHPKAISRDKVVIEGEMVINKKKELIHDFKITFEI